MRELQSLERFEIEVLELLNRKRLLDKLTFCGGTMLRLCHNAGRYSTDLDFWMKPGIDYREYFGKIKSALAESFLVRDAENKRNTLVFEIQSEKSKRSLKIEIRKDQADFQWERKIAFSKFSTVQVAVKGLTLEQMMINKIQALLSRKQIRDCYDIEFLMRRGTALNTDPKNLSGILGIIDGFNVRDYKVSLGSLLEASERQFFTANRFQLLREEIVKNMKGLTLKTK